MPYCPKCGYEVSGTANFCRACGLDLKEEQPQAERPSEVKEVTAEPAKQYEPVGLSAKCANHPERDSVGVCVACGKGICTYCRTVVEGKGYCPSCVEKLVIEETKSISDTTSSRSTSGTTYSESAFAPMGWNWGAFFLTWIWGVFNNVWISLLCFIPLVGWVMCFILGAYGSQWAWEKSEWESVEHFRRVQRKWARAGFIVGIAFLIVVILNIILLEA